MNNKFPNLRHLHAFYVTVQYNNISQATQQIFLSQSAITQAIQKIEKMLGVKLFKRQGKSLIATPEAKLYAVRVQRFFDFISKGLQETLKIEIGKSNRNTRLSHRNAKELTHLVTATQIQALLAMGETLNYTHAAKQLGTSQPAIHRAIRALEQLLELPLFEKTSQGLELTKAGLVIWQKCKLAVNELAQGIMDIQAFHHQFEGKITIGSMPLSRHELLPKALITFKQHYPRIDIHVIDGSYDTLLQALHTAHLDFLLGALRTIESTDPQNALYQIPLFDSQLCIALRPTHPLVIQSQHQALTMTDLLAYPWVLPAPHTPTRERFEHLLANHQVQSPTNLIETSSAILIRGLLIEGDYLTLISRQQVEYEVAQGILTILNFNISDSPRQIGLSYRQNWQPSQVHQVFLDCIIATSNHLVP